MLIENQKVQIKWNGHNKRFYEEKGYKFTKKGDLFDVKVEDLSISSGSNVEVLCDYCGAAKTVAYNNYIKSLRSINKYACKDCVGYKCAEVTLGKRQKMLYVQIHDKCIENGYELLTNENEIKNNRTEIMYRCQLHGIQRMRLANMLSGKKCPKCARESARKKYQLSKTDVCENIRKYGGELLNPDAYINICTKNLIILCPECKKELITSYRNFTQHGGQVCEECAKHSESMGERKIRHYLEDNLIDFSQEYWFIDCRDKKPLPFDFYIKSKNLIIEFDGRQHYENNGFFKHSHQKTLVHDKIKNEYCKKRNIDLLRIPYWEYNNIENILSDKLNNSHKDIV